MPTPAERLHENFLARVAVGDFPPATNAITPEDAGIDAAVLIDLFESQILSRHVDAAARSLKAAGQGYYTISGAGHEGNAVFGSVFRPTDMAFLHYRSGAFLIQRAKHVPGQQPVRDILLSAVASSDDPVSGGRHKVLGNAAVLVPPQTSTIASHLPKAMGSALAVDLAGRLGMNGGTPPDAVVVCTFGDASANHSTALGAMNAAAWFAHQGTPMPIIFICEDNGIGISVPTPPDWIPMLFANRPELHYLYCDGLDLADCWRGAAAAEALARHERVPVFLHVRMVRLTGHAGEDMESEYRAAQEIEQDENNDPLLHTARRLAEGGMLSGAQIRELYLRLAEQVTAVAREVTVRPKLGSRAEVMSTLLPPVRTDLPRPGPLPRRDRETKPQPMARHINLALADLMTQFPEIVLCGQDIARKGGVYGVTSGLLKKFGADRVIDTLLDEQSILGLALGLAHNNLLAIPEIQFLAYVHNALDQIRGEAATLPYFSRGAFRNPTVVRLPGLAYQKGFGGHFHNDNSLTAFRDIPGIVMACPSNGPDAAAMLRACVRMAREQGRVVLFVEPIALYYTRDLHEPGDGLWAAPYAPDGEIAPGTVGVHGAGTDLCILTYGNGVFLSRQAEKVLSGQYGMSSRIVDLRWLAPLPEAEILRAVSDSRRILIVDEGRRSGSISEGLCTLLLEAGVSQPVSRITGADCFIPLGDAAQLMLPTRDEIVAAALRR
ncbi:MAG: MFS transporter [Gammaproteobacteria bacterium]|nr:MFS transporter [Gammaproteobacteria bacterium]